MKNRTRTRTPARPGAEARRAAAGAARKHKRIMADNSKKNASQPDADGGGPQSTESLEKVRDILFGARARDSDKRFTRLEERIARGLEELRDESRKRLDSLEGFIKKEMQAVSDRIKVEQAQRSEALKGLAQELKETGRGFEARTSEMDDRSAEAQRELRQELLDQSKTLRDEVQQSRKEVDDVLARVVDELRSEKTDRSTLAELFTDMAVRLSGDPEKSSR